MTKATIAAVAMLRDWHALPENERFDFLHALESRAAYWRLSERQRAELERARYLRFRKAAVAPPPEVADQGDDDLI